MLELHLPSLRTDTIFLPGSQHSITALTPASVSRPSAGQPQMRLECHHRLDKKKLIGDGYSTTWAVGSYGSDRTKWRRQKSYLNFFPPLMRRGSFPCIAIYAVFLSTNREELYVQVGTATQPVTRPQMPVRPVCRSSSKRLQRSPASGPPWSLLS